MEFAKLAFSIAIAVAPAGACGIDRPDRLYMNMLPRVSLAIAGHANEVALLIFSMVVRLLGLLMGFVATVVWALIDMGMYSATVVRMWAACGGQRCDVDTELAPQAEVVPLRVLQVLVRDRGLAAARRDALAESGRGAVGNEFILDHVDGHAIWRQRWIVEAERCRNLSHDNDNNEYVSDRSGRLSRPPLER